MTSFSIGPAEAVEVASIFPFFGVVSALQSRATIGKEPPAK